MLNNSQLYARVGRRQFKVQSLGQVSAAYRDLLTKMDLGSSQAPRCLIVDGAGTIHAHVSYNGRVWAGEVYHYGAQPLYTPED